MKKIYLSLCAIIFVAIHSFGQASSANYAFSVSNTGSLTDMSSGTTQLVASFVDDGASPVTNIGFDFWLLGTRYTQFTVSSNGFLRLGSTAVSGTQYVLGTAGNALIAAFGGDFYTSTSGKIHYKLTGTAPNRVLVIEFKNMTIIYDYIGTSADGTYQLRMFEGSNNMEFAYGSMNRNSSTVETNPQFIGFSTTSAIDNTYATVNNTTNVSNTTGAIVSNTNTVGAPIVNLNSSADGNRTIYDYAATTTAAPTALNFTAVTTGSETLNWTDNSSDETGFAIYRSLDGGVTYNYVTTTAANVTTYTATGLTQNTAYTWKVSAVRETLSAPTTGSQSTSAAGMIASNGTGGGLWSLPSTWVGGVVPGSGDIVTITAGDLVTEDLTAAAAYSLTVNGTLEYDGVAARTVTTSFNATIAAGGIFRTPATGTVITNVFAVGGDLINNGILDFSTNGNTAGAGITFTNATNNTFGGSGAITNIRTLTINKGTSNVNILELNPTNFTVQGVSTDVAGYLTLTAGTIKISGTFTETNRTFTVAAYSIPAAAGIWFNNPNYIVSGQNGSPTVAGMLRMTQGILNVGTSTGNSMALTTGSTEIIEGGSINTAGRFAVSSGAQAINYTQTAGTITVCTVGNTSTTLGSFDMGTSLVSNINISGGTVICQLQATGFDYRNQAGSGNTGVTGGTAQFGNALSGAAKAYNIRGVAPNVVVTNTSANHKLTWSGTLVNYNNISLNVTTDPGDTLNFGSTVFLFNGTVITNNGIMIDSLAASNFVTFNTVAPVSYTGSGNILGSFTGLSLQSTQGFTIDPASSGIRATAVRLFYGNLTNSNKLTVGNGGTTAATIQIGNTTTPTAAGTFDSSPTFNAGSGGVVLSYLRTAAARSTGPEVPPTRIINTLTVDENDPTHTLTVTGGDITATGTFTLANGNIITGANTVVSGSSVAVPGTFTYTAGVIIGNFKRWITTTGANWNFPVGILNTARNASIDFTANPPTTGGSLTASFITSPEGTNGLPLTEPNANGGETLTQTSAEGYWSVIAADGLTGGTYTGTFTATGITSADYTRLVLIKRASGGGGNPWTLDGTYVTTSGTAAAPVVSRTGMIGFSEFGLAADAGLLATNLAYFHGAKSGNGNYLDWKVNVAADAVNVSLERSADGIAFAGLYNVSATAASSLNPFVYNDASPLNGKNFYRLRLTEISGRVFFSNVIVLVNSGKATEIVSIVPNPVTNGTFSLNVSAAKAISITVVITDMNGRTVGRQLLNVGAGYSSSKIDVSGLAAGAYELFGVTAEGKTTTTGFIIK